jgi:hypothetical protein
MTARLINLDDRRPKIREPVKCLHCCTSFDSTHKRDRGPNEYIPGCPGCDEVAAIPVWQWLYGR